MSNAKRSIAQLRAEKGARLRNTEEGMALRDAVIQAVNRYENHGFADPSTRCLQVAAILQDAARACTLLEKYPSFFERAVAHQYKGGLHRDLGQIGEALATYREARRLYALAGPQLIPEADGSVHRKVAQNSTMVLCDIVQACVSFFVPGVVAEELCQQGHRADLSLLQGALAV